MGARLIWGLAGLLAAAIVSGCGASARPPSDGGIPRQLLLEARPIGRGERFHPPATGPVTGSCLSGLGPRAGVHVEVFAANRVVLVPAGIGTRPPRTLFAGRIARARCYGELVTIDPTGLLLVRPSARLSVAALFRAWGQPLGPQRLTSFSGPVTVFVDGRRWRGAPGDVPLRRHAEIVLETGPHVPPHSFYAFPMGT